MKRLILIGLFGIFVIIGGLYLPAGSQTVPTSIDPYAVHISDTLTGDVTATFESDGSTATTVTDLTITSEAQGDVLYFNGSNWVRLAKGSAGQVLEMNAGATAPEWDTDDTGAGGGDAVLVNTTGITDANGVDLTDGTGITITLNAGASPDTATFAATLGTAIDTTEITDGTIAEVDLKVVDSPTDEDIFTYEQTTGDFEWHSAAELGIGTATSITDDLIVNADINSSAAIDVSKTALIPGNALTLSTNTLNFDGGAAPGGELGGTWASPTIDDSVSVSGWTIDSPIFTTAFTATDLIDSDDYVAGSIDPEHVASGAWDFGTSLEADTLTEGGVGVPNVNDNLSVFAATTSAQLAGVISDETGYTANDKLVFNLSPEFNNSIIIDDTTDVSSPNLDFHRDRSTGGDVQSGDRLGQIVFYGYHTDGYDGAARIDVDVDGTPGNGDMPGRIEFFTSADGSASPIERMEIDNAGNIQLGQPGTNYVQITYGGAMTFSGTADIDLPADSVDIADLNATGTPSSSTYLRGDGSWQTPGGSGDMTKAVYDVAEDGYVDANDTAYGASWNGNVNAPTMNAVYDQIETLGGDMTKAVYDVAEDGYVDANDTAYAASWNGNVNAPTMNAVYDKIETISAGATAWDDIGDPDGNGTIDFSTHTAELDVNDFRIGATDAGNYWKFAGGQFSRVGASAMFVSDFIIDDDTGDTPYLYLRDGDGQWLRFIKNDAGDADISNSEGSIDIQPNGDTNDYLRLSTSSNIITLETIASGDGDLVIQAGGGDISFNDDNLTTTGTLEAATITEGGVGVPNLNETDWINQTHLDEDNAPSDGDILTYDSTGTNFAWITQNAGTDITADLEEEITWGVGLAIATQTASVDLTELTGNRTWNDGSTDASFTITFDLSSGTDPVLTLGDGVFNISAGALQEGGNAVYNSSETPGGILGGTWASPTIDTDAINDTHIDWGSGANQIDLADIPGGTAPANSFDFGGADLEIPQASPGAPDADGEIEFDFTDGSLVIQHGSAHAELSSSTDVVIGKLIKSFSATIFAPDQVNDVIPLKPIVSGEFPHGIVVTEVHMVVGTDSNYTIDVENWDDFDTINASNSSINSTSYTSGNNGEVTDSTITYSTIAAGQIIMLDIPATDIDWVNITVFYYEPIS